MDDFSIANELTYHDQRPTHRVVPDIVTQAKADFEAAWKAKDQLIERRMRGSISDDDYCLEYTVLEQAEVEAENRMRLVVQAWNLGLLVEYGPVVPETLLTENDYNGQPVPYLSMTGD